MASESQNLIPQAKGDKVKNGGSDSKKSPIDSKLPDLEPKQNSDVELEHEALNFFHASVRDEIEFTDHWHYVSL